MIENIFLSEKANIYLVKINVENTLHRIIILKIRNKLF